MADESGSMGARTGRGYQMLRPLTLLGMCSLTFLLPTVAFAQGSIAGSIRDQSGALLPGVAVEAASPVLIEKVRTAIADGSGRYRIENLRPGDYTVTFSLAGFSVVKRENVIVSGTTVTTVDADMMLGGVAETITITG